MHSLAVVVLWQNEANRFVPQSVPKMYHRPNHRVNRNLYHKVYLLINININETKLKRKVLTLLKKAWMNFSMEACSQEGKGHGFQTPRNELLESAWKTGMNQI